jgi:glycerol kinase
MVANKKVENFIIALDQGTTGSRAILFNSRGKIICSFAKEFKQIYPKPGWVEHDPMDIWQSQLDVINKLLDSSKVDIRSILAIGITNQRETVVLWDRKTGKPVYNAIVWQCRRTAEICDRLRAENLSGLIKKKTGLLPDPYFSGTKIKWILDNVDGVRDKANNGDICAGTIDSWLIWNLTGGKVHATDFSNASRTMLFNINTLQWDDELLEIFNIPREVLPEVKPSSCIFGLSDRKITGVEIPLASAIGDQQAALFGQACFNTGMAKCTYGTGCFILMNCGTKIPQFENDLIVTIAWGLNKKITYALEGSIFIGGAAIQWLRDGLHIIKTAKQCDEFAEKVSDTNEIYFVPALVGLGAPYWDSTARGTIIGITRGVTREHLARAALEAIAYQVKDVLNVMKENKDSEIKLLRVDGGASVSNVMLQFQADILRVDVTRPKIIETTALGAAFLAGLQMGIWENMEEISRICIPERTFTAQMDLEYSDKIYKGWIKAVSRSLKWAD